MHWLNPKPGCLSALRKVIILTGLKVRWNLFSDDIITDTVMAIYGATVTTVTDLAIFAVTATARTAIMIL